MCHGRTTVDATLMRTVALVPRLGIVDLSTQSTVSSLWMADTDSAPRQIRTDRNCLFIPPKLPVVAGGRFQSRDK